MLIWLVCQLYTWADDKLCFTNYFIGMEYPLTFGFIEHVSLQDINLLSNVYCPTAECQLDQFISLGLCDSCTSQDASLDGNFWNGAAQHEDEYQGCINTAQLGNTETEFRWNYTGMKDHVAAGEPVRWERKCIIRKPEYPELDMRIITDYLGGEAWPKVGITNSDLRFSNGYRLGIIRLERDLLYRSLRLYTALNSDPVWTHRTLLLK